MHVVDICEPMVLELGTIGHQSRVPHLYILKINGIVLHTRVFTTIFGCGSHIVAIFIE